MMLHLYIFILRRPEVVRAQEFAKPGTLPSLFSPPLQDSEGGSGFPSVLTPPRDIDNDLSHAWHFKPPRVSPGSVLQQISTSGASELGPQSIQFQQQRGRHREAKQKQNSGPLTPSRLFEPPNSLTFGFRYVFTVLCQDQLFLRTSSVFI